MKTATITETKNHLSALLHEVQRGETIVVLDRTKPVARIESMAATPDEYRGEGERIKRLERAGVLLRPRGGTRSDVLSGRPIRTAGGASAVQALLEERESGR